MGPQNSGSLWAALETDQGAETLEIRLSRLQRTSTWLGSLPRMALRPVAGHLFGGRSACSCRARHHDRPPSKPAEWARARARVHLALVKLAGGSRVVFERNRERATMDWRDTLCAAGLENDDFAPCEHGLRAPEPQPPLGHRGRTPEPLRGELAAALPSELAIRPRFYRQGETGLCGRTSHRQAVDAGE